MDDELGEYMRGILEQIALLGVRVSAVETILSNVPGLGMETDPSRLPVIVVEETTRSAA